MPFCVPEDAGAVWKLEALQGTLGRVTRIAGLGSLIHRVPHLGLIRGKQDRPLLAEHPDPSHPLLLPNGTHDMEGIFPAILEHGVMGAPLDGVAELAGSPYHEVYPPRLLVTNIHPGEHTNEHQSHAADCGQEFGFQTVQPSHLMVFHS